jgi:3-hydroxyisobutyrate dehydrogenase-like beta-hydroxyacid dehydrogenase
VSAGRVGFIGLGIMGSRMAANLRRASFDLVVWNRTAETARRWAEEHGAEVASSPAEVGERCDRVITMVVDGDQVASILFDHGLCAALAARDGGPSLVVDTSTIGPAAARRIGAELSRQGIAFLDAPVTGSSPKAEDGTLTIMVGGERRDFERARPLFEAMGKLIVHAGGSGDGQAVKVINNTVAAANTATVGEALLLGKSAGLDLDALVTVMKAGSGASAMLELKERPMREHDFTTLFKLAHMLKDVRLCLEEARAAGVPFDLGEATESILREADTDGHGDQDFAALLEALEKRAGVSLGD